MLTVFILLSSSSSLHQLRISVGQTDYSCDTTATRCALPPRVPSSRREKQTIRSLMQLHRRKPRQTEKARPMERSYTSQSLNVPWPSSTSEAMKSLKLVPPFLTHHYYRT